MYLHLYILWYTIYITSPRHALRARGRFRGLDPEGENPLLAEGDCFLGVHYERSGNTN
jgi:hypothetical protein